MILSNKECKAVVAGSLTGSILSAIKDLIKTITDIGRQCGSAIRRIASKKSCSI